MSFILRKNLFKYLFIFIFCFVFLPTSFVFSQTNTTKDSLMPPCAEDGSCDDINVFVELILNYANILFSMIGGIAFVFFVYGGFTIILSMGNPEKVKQGQGILVAAVVGLVIAFSAYLLIDFILDALNVSSDFRGVK